MRVFGLGDYVKGDNGLCIAEGKIVDMFESRGAKQGMLYEVDDRGTLLTTCFFAEELQPIVMPTKYDHTLFELCKEYYFLNGDKRVARLDLYKNKSVEITKDNDSILLTFTAYGKNYYYNTTLDNIIDTFKNKPYCEYKHICC